MDWAVIFSGLTVWSAVLFVLGLVFLVLEMLEPGFGAFGLLGLACMVVDVFISAKSLEQGLILAGLILLVLLILFLIFLRLASKGKLPKRLVLSDSAERQEGYSTSEDLGFLLGKSGRTITPLRPAGTVLIEGGRYDVVTSGGYIEPEQEVRVTEVEGRRIVVEPLPVRAQP